MFTAKPSPDGYDLTGRARRISVSFTLHGGWYVAVPAC